MSSIIGVDNANARDTCLPITSFNLNIPKLYHLEGATNYNVWAHIWNMLYKKDALF
jgi:hypothetical protein